jgi:hypothetical protein
MMGCNYEIHRAARLVDRARVPQQFVLARIQAHQ